MKEKIIGIRFNRRGRVYNFDPGRLECPIGQQVIVETEQGLALGVVQRLQGPGLLDEHPNPDFQLSCPQHAMPTPAVQDHALTDTLTETTSEPPTLPAPPLKKVLRLASPEDLKQAQRNQELEKKAMTYCRQKIAELNLNMALVQAECLFDRSKIIIYFTSEERLDFRELVHDLAAHMRGKVELRQIGVRQEAKMLGGLGSCGRELCCAHILQEFAQVGVKMAKEQSLSLNPAKISGLCGRLMCCLGYEFETYRALYQEMPKVGKKIKISTELEAKILRHSPLTGQLTLQLSDGRTVTCTMAEMADLEPMENTRRGGRVIMKSLPQEEEASSPLPTSALAASDEEEEKVRAKRRPRRSRGRRRGKKAPNSNQESGSA